VTCQFEKITKGQNQLSWVYYNLSNTRLLHKIKFIQIDDNRIKSVISTLQRLFQKILMFNKTHFYNKMTVAKNNKFVQYSDDCKK